MGPRMRLIAAAGVTALTVACLAGLLSGCSLHYKDWDHSLFQFVPSDSVLTSTTSVIGVDLAPTGVDGPGIRVGYVRSQRTSVPGFDNGTYVPDVTATTGVDANTGAFISETLEVGTRE